MWRKDLDPAVKTKLYTFLLSYGRIGSDSDIKTAKGVLADLIWSPFRPSSDSQLIPIRVLEANKNLMKAQADEKLSADEKADRLRIIRTTLKSSKRCRKRRSPTSSRSGWRPLSTQAGNQDELNKMIAEFAGEVVFASRPRCCRCGARSRSTG